MTLKRNSKPLDLRDLIRKYDFRILKPLLVIILKLVDSQMKKMYIDQKPYDMGHIFSAKLQGNSMIIFHGR